MAKSLGQKAYEAFTNYMKWNSSRSFVWWIDLPNVEREAWDAAINEIKSGIIDEYIDNERNP